MKKLRNISKILSLTVVATFLLVALMVTSPITASAAEVASGSCGNDLAWSLSEEGVLTISGTGGYDIKPMVFQKSKYQKCNIAEWLDHDLQKCFFGIYTT